MRQRRNSEHVFVFLETVEGLLHRSALERAGLRTVAGRTPGHEERLFFVFVFLQRRLKDLYCLTVAQIAQTVGRYVLPLSRHHSHLWVFFYVLSFVHLFLTARLIAPIAALLHRRDTSVTDGDFELPALPIRT